MILKFFFIDVIKTTKITKSEKVQTALTVLFKIEVLFFCPSGRVHVCSKSIKRLFGICTFLYLLRFYWNRPEPVRSTDPCGIVKTVFVLLAWSSLIGEGGQAAGVMPLMPCQPASLGYREQPLVGFNRGVLLPRWDSVSLIRSGEGGGRSDHVQHSFA